MIDRDFYSNDETVYSAEFFKVTYVLISVL